MKVLIITTYYPPDTAIAAKRPYMFAKYLSFMGHEVTVLRSGLINGMIDPIYTNNGSVRVISVLGEKSPVVKNRNSAVINNSTVAKSRIQFVPYRIRKYLSAGYHSLMKPVKYIKTKRVSEQLLELQKKAIDALSEESFDIVFSTFGEMENMYGGEYASSVFQCRWIMDFRDSVAQKDVQPWWEYQYKYRIQKAIASKADICTAVSNGVGQFIGANTITLYNGFDQDEVDHFNKTDTETGVLKICYTGAVYRLRAEALEELLKAIKTLIEQRRIDRNKIIFSYAGRDSDLVNELFKNHGLIDILQDYSYIGKEIIYKIQNSSDIFLVLSWNTKNQQGIITGKFPEGVGLQKPIITIVAGDMPSSELYMLNDKYRYGFCYEKCRGEEQFDSFCDYLASVYQEKMENGKVAYQPSDGLLDIFRYDRITKKLNGIFLSLTDKK